jgi:hypothetical protein
MRQLVDDVVADYDDRSLSGTLPTLGDAPQVARQVYDAVAGFGPLQQHLDDPTVEEIWINAPGRVFIARRGRSELTTTILQVDEVRDVVERMLKASGRRVDLSTPFVDAMLPDGSRLHVVIPDITRRDWAVKTAQSFSYISISPPARACAPASGERSGVLGDVGKSRKPLVHAQSDVGRAGRRSWRVLVCTGCVPVGLDP